MTAEKFTNEKVADLLQKAFSGDREAATSLLRSYTNDMYYVAKLYMEDTEAAKKMVQKSFVTAYKKLGEVTDASMMEEWLTDITRKKAVSSMVPYKAEKCDAAYTEEDEAPEEGVQLPGKIDVCKKYVLAALNVLSAPERTAAALRWYDHKSIAETAELMQAEPEMVQTWLTNAKECFEEAGMAFGRFAALVNGINPAPVKIEVPEEDDGLIPTRSLKLAEIAAAAAAAEEAAAKAEAARIAAEEAAEAARLAEEAKAAAEAEAAEAAAQAEEEDELPEFPEEPEDEMPAFPEEETPVFPEEPEEPVFPDEPSEIEKTAALEMIDDEDELDLSAVPSAAKFVQETEKTRVISSLKDVPENHTIWEEDEEATAEQIFNTEEQENSSNITRDVETKTPSNINPRNIYEDDDEDEDDEDDLSPRERRRREKAEAKRRKRMEKYEEEEEDYDEYDDDEYDDDEGGHPVLTALLILLIVLALAAGGIVFLYKKDRVLFNKLPFSDKIVEIAKKVTGKDEPAEISVSVSADSADSAEPAGSTATEQPSADSVIGKAEVVIDELHVRSKAGTDGDNIGSVYSGDVYDVYEIASDDDYDWYRIGEDKWIADVEGEYLEYTSAN